ncbi:MAG: FAD-binding protein [Myxococcales bacterium]|nr:FAD-binding protein [Myxococcales bacterium]
MAGRWDPAQGPLRLPTPEAAGFSASDKEEVADVVIVGAGPGGSACARALALAGAKVIVIEEGPARQRYARHFGPSMRHHQQEGGAMVAMSAAPIPIAAGRGLGGGTIINSAIAWRAPDAVLAGWAEVVGDDGFAPSVLEPVYDMLWGLLGIWSTRLEIAGENNAIIVRGAEKCGYEGGYLERATPGCSGCGVCYYGCPTGGKASVDTNLLADAVANGARIQAETKVDRILIDRVDGTDRAVGVSGQMFDPDTGEPGGRCTVRARRVVIAAGGVGTPRLLHHAGLGGRLGPAVGEGLHLHPGNAVLGWCDHEVLLWKGATQGAYFHPPGLHGVLPHTFSSPPEALLSLLTLTGQATKEALPRFKNLCGCVVMISDSGTGSVRAWGDGRARISYTFAEDDIDRIKAGMYHTARVLLAGGARVVFAPVYGTSVYKTAESLRDALAPLPVANFTLYASHPMSSCRMGKDPAASVIGPTGESHGLAGLYITDSSIFPTSLGVNPSLTTMAMGTLLGERMGAG